MNPMLPPKSGEFHVKEHTWQKQNKEWYRPNQNVHGSIATESKVTDFISMINSNND